MNHVVNAVNARRFMRMHFSPFNFWFRVNYGDEYLIKEVNYNWISLKRKVGGRGSKCVTFWQYKWNGREEVRVVFSNPLKCSKSNIRKGECDYDHPTPNALPLPFSLFSSLFYLLHIFGDTF